MCLTVDLSKHVKSPRHKYPQPLVAKKGFRVWKKVYGPYRRNGVWNYCSPWRNFTYQRRQHYYQTGKKKFVIVQPAMFDSTYFEIYVGLHSFKSKPHISAGAMSKAIECFIPKGAKYFIGMNNDIVSDQLIIL